MELLSIAALKRAAASNRVETAVHVQIEAVQKKETRDQKPYYEISVADAEAKLTLRAWSDSPMFAHCANLEPGSFIEISGEFAHNGSFGVESKRWSCRELEIAEREALLGGPAELRQRQERDFEEIRASVAGLRDPRLHALGELFLAEFGERFRRTAAARNYHHARRGGLVEHVAQMIRSAGVLATVYPRLNRDLLVVGALLHDCGKLWENALPENGFVMGYDERGELLGHITIGVELVNALWRKLDPGPWATLQPASEDVRLHLLHLIAAHHGEPQFGSPVVPKTPEAWALHHIDNLDAKMEMMFAGYENAASLAPRIFERVRPLPGNLVAPLPPIEEPPAPDTESVSPD
jgi:3'-5' exoribonuclease